MRKKILLPVVLASVVILFAMGCIEPQPKKSEASFPSLNNAIIGNETFAASDAPITLDWIDLFGQKSAMFYFSNRDPVAHVAMVVVKSRSGTAGYRFELPASIGSHVLIPDSIMGKKGLEITVMAENIEVQKIVFASMPTELGLRYGIDRSCRGLSQCQWEGYWHANGHSTSAIEVKAANASEIGMAKKPLDDVAAIEEINDTLFTLGAKRVNIKPVYAQPVMNYYATATVPYGPASIEANFLLFGSAAKKGIIAGELGQVREFVDDCARNGYRNLSLQTGLLGVPSGKVQKRQWSGSGQLALGSGFATISLTQNSSMVNSTATPQATEEIYKNSSYVEKKNTLGKNLVLNTDIKGIRLRLGQKKALQWVNCGPCLNCYEEGHGCNYWYETLWATAKSQGVMTAEQLSAAQNAIEKERYWKLTFVNNTAG